MAFQHRERATHDFGPRMDRFSALVIHASLRVVAVAPELWFRLHDGDNLLFRREDFQDPETGRAFSTLKDALRASGNRRTRSSTQGRRVRADHGCAGAGAVSDTHRGECRAEWGAAATGGQGIRFVAQ